MQVRNQGYLRRKNKETIINLLRRNTQSYSDLAREIRLSNAAVGKIVDDLIRQDIVLREDEIRGRGGINLSINKTLGYIIAIDLSGRQISVCAADFGSNILVSREIGEIITFTIADLKKLIDVVREMTLCEQLKNQKLCGICLASPGKIDKSSGKFILNPRFEGFEDISLNQVFSKEFSCFAFVKNDINLALAGEKMYGSSLREQKNALMLHIDVGTGSALLLDSKIYEGNNGFAGEIGYLKLNTLLSGDDELGNINYSNYYDSLSLFSQLTIVRRELVRGAHSVINDWIKPLDVGGVTINMMALAYKEGDPLVRRIANAAAKIIGSVGKNIMEFLDIQTLVLNGSIVGYGQPFIQALQMPAGYNVTYVSLMERATLMGAVNAGINAVYEQMLV